MGLFEFKNRRPEKILPRINHLLGMFGRIGLSEVEMGFVHDVQKKQFF